MPRPNKCVVIQGTYENKESVKKIRNSFLLSGDYQIIWSTWNYIPKDWFYPSEIVIQNNPPSHSGHANYNYQKISTINGMMKAMELGYKRAIKWRSDMIPTNPFKLYELFGDGLNIYFWVNSEMGYVADFVFEGECEDIIKIFSPEDGHKEKLIFPEHSITRQIYRNELNFKTQTFGQNLTNENDIFWIKRNYHLSENKNHPSLYFTRIPLNWKAYPLI
jgi:hypothetical protein